MGAVQKLGSPRVWLTDYARNHIDECCLAFRERGVSLHRYYDGVLNREICKRVVDYRYDPMRTREEKQTCNPPARFLASATSTAIGDLIRALWQVTDEAAYQRLLDVVTEMTMDYIDEHPELREQSAPDMWDYQDEQEDRDDYDDEDEY